MTGYEVSKVNYFPLSLLNVNQNDFKDNLLIMYGKQDYM
jgi:hypothetical protein